MAVTVNVTINQAEVDRFLRGENGPVGRNLRARAERVESVAQVLVGVDTGQLRASIRTWMTTRGGELAAFVGSDLDYALVHHEGRGPVFPRRARVLVFRPKGGGNLVFTTRSAAVPPNPYLTDALALAFA